MRIGAAYFPVTLSYASYNSPSWLLVMCVGRACRLQTRRIESIQESLGSSNLKNAWTVDVVRRTPLRLTVPGTEI